MKPNRKKTPLPTVFELFLKQIAGVEVIDDLELTQSQIKAGKADYFFEGREIIAELKTIETDPGPKQEQFIENLKSREDWPIFFGERSLNRLIRDFPDKEEINSNLFNTVSDGIETIFRGANRQIRETKSSFTLPDSSGVLILLNDASPTFEPKVITHRMAKCFKKLNVEGQQRFPEIAAALVIHTAHVLVPSPDIVIFPMYAMANPNFNDERAIKFLDELAADWSSFQGIPMERRDWGKMDQEFYPR